MIGRDGDDALVGGAGNDYFVIFGNRIAGYKIEGAEASGTDEDFTNLVFFARDFNPDNFMIRRDKPHANIANATYSYAEIEFGLHTNEAVTLNLSAAAVPDPATGGFMRNVHAVATGAGNDTVTGTNYTAKLAYLKRFQATIPGTHEMQVHEMFFTQGGNDTIDTQGGNNFVDAGAGADTIIIGSGAQRIYTGAGGDVIRVDLAKLNGPEQTGGSTIVFDFDLGDRIDILGQLAVTNVTIAAATGETKVSVNAKEEFRLRGIARRDVKVTAITGGVAISVEKRENQVAPPPNVGPTSGASTPSGK